MTFKRSHAYVAILAESIDECEMLDAVNVCADCAALLKKCSPTFAALLLEEMKEEILNGRH